MKTQIASTFSIPSSCVILVAASLLGGALTPGVRAQTPPLDDFNPQADGEVDSLAVQADGKILVGGVLGSLGGLPHAGPGRLNASGSLDVGFIRGAGSDVYALAVQPDGKILVGGGFLSLGGQLRKGIGRVNADGTLDEGFDPGAFSQNPEPWVLALAVQADGKILLGGFFTTLGGQPRDRIGRLNPDGTVDMGFNPGTSGGVIGCVNSLAVQPDGKILVGGGFTNLAGQPCNYLGRVNADGSLDTGFNPLASRDVYCLAVQPDGKIVVGGLFGSLGGQPRFLFGRLNANGSLDTGFNPGVDAFVYSLALQADGKILVGGSFSTLGGQPRFGIGRLNANGTLDQGFNPGMDVLMGDVRSLAVQADGKILVGGILFQPSDGLARLYNTGPVSQSLTRDSSTITWLRGGPSPEVWRTTFEHSTDGIDWTNLGAGTRIAGGWRLTGLSLPPGGTIRARGYTTGGHYNASTWFVETKSTATLGGCGVSTNGFGFDVKWASGIRFVVEASTNLAQPLWYPVQTNTMAADAMRCSDPDWTNYADRVYRIRAE